MILKELIEKQRLLDEMIVKEHNLQNKNLFSNKIVAFIVELSELANEIRFFKHWSLKGSSTKEVILEEFSDCMHFLLSIGNELNNNEIYEMDYYFKSCDDYTVTFIDIVSFVTNLDIIKVTNSAEYTSHLYCETMRMLLGFADKLGFTSVDILKGYDEKHKINYIRQKEKY